MGSDSFFENLIRTLFPTRVYILRPMFFGGTDWFSHQSPATNHQSPSSFPPRHPVRILSHRKRRRHFQRFQIHHRHLDTTDPRNFCNALAQPLLLSTQLHRPTVRARLFLLFNRRGSARTPDLPHSFGGFAGAVVSDAPFGAALGPMLTIIPVFLGKTIFCPRERKLP